MKLGGWRRPRRGRAVAAGLPSGAGSGCWWSALPEAQFAAVMRRRVCWGCGCRLFTSSADGICCRRASGRPRNYLQEGVGRSLNLPATGKCGRETRRVDASGRRFAQLADPCCGSIGRPCPSGSRWRTPRRPLRVSAEAACRRVSRLPEHAAGRREIQLPSGLAVIIWGGRIRWGGRRRRGFPKQLGAGQRQWRRGRTG